MRLRSGYPVIFAAMLAIILAVTPAAGSRRKQRASNPQPGQFDYYLLALSWAPDFCALPDVRKDPRECAPGRKLGFVVHGLWPQGKQGRGPQKCGPARPVSEAIIRPTLNYVPTESLIQHEWANHGTCSGLSSAEYFALLRKARDSVRIPEELKAPQHQIDMSPAEIEAKFAAANPTFPRAAFTVSCTQGALQEARICLNKDLSPRACSPNTGHCALDKIVVRPVQ